MYKLLGLDIDGTLLNTKHEVSEKNRKFIKELDSKGVKVVLISGREPLSVKHFNKELNLNNPIIGLNGGIITDHIGEKIFYENCIAGEDAKRIIDLAESFNMFSIVFIRDLLYIGSREDNRFEIFSRYSHSPTREIGNLSEYLEKNRLWSSINKVLLADDNEKLLEYKNALQKGKKDRLTMGFSLPFFLEVYNSETSKGNALVKLGNILDIDKNEMITIGDGENDITMIEYADIGVAMANAPENVKDVADYVTLTNDEDGVSHVIQKFWNL